MDMLLLMPLKRFSSLGVLLLRLAVGGMLLWSIGQTAFNEQGLRAFAAFLSKFHFPLPYLMARLSAYAQIFVGVGFIAGLLTRWAGLVCAVNFAVMLAMVERFAGIRGAFPSACLVAIGVFLALHGAGRFGLDALLESRVRGRPRFDYRSIS